MIETLQEHSKYDCNCRGVWKYKFKAANLEKNCFQTYVWCFVILELKLPKIMFNSGLFNNIHWKYNIYEIKLRHNE